MKNHKIFSILIALLFLATAANADLLVNSTVDKKFLYPDEVGFLTIKVLNDSNISQNLMLRIEGADNLIFVEEGIEKKTILKEMTNIRPNEPAQVTIKLKATAVKTDPSPIFVYYGTKTDDSEKGLPYVSGTITQTKANPVEVITKAEKKSKEEGEVVETTITITNKSGKEIKAIATETIAPKDFDIKTEPKFYESLSDKNSITVKSEVLVPIDVDGEQDIIVAYGFYDEFGPHYFEKVHKFNFVKTNRTLLAIIGLIVLVAAIYLYVQQAKKGSNLKGSADIK